MLRDSYVVKSAQQGVVYALSCYVIWGVFPIYFRALEPLPAGQILLHRMVWSMLFLALVLGLRRQWSWLPEALANPLLVGRYAASAVMLSTNWFIYIWACNAGHVVDASLGYFINPLVNVLLGFVVLRERLRPLQVMAILCAVLGVAWLTLAAGRPPWIGLALAFSFAFYGLLRKTAPLGALEGLTLETLVLLPFALACLVWLTVEGSNGFGRLPLPTQALLVAAGPITAIPLLMFGAAARRISFSLLGLLQYLCPSLQLLVGVFLYGEAFSRTKALGYAAIWLGLIAYSAESLWQARRVARQAAPLAPDPATA
jgi:chloramphenicol-sensitive protein RarD